MTTDAPTPEQVLAKSVRYHRVNRLHLTALQLSDRVKELGGSLTRQAISKIETGVRGVSLDEIVLLARALNIPPLLLLFPIGVEAEQISEQIQLTPGNQVDMWSAACSFSGETDWDETEWRVPLFLFRRHAGLLAECPVAMPRTNGEAGIESRAESLLCELRGVRAEMRRHGLRPPSPEIPATSRAVGPFDCDGKAS